MNRAMRAILLEASEDELRDAFADTTEDIEALAARGRASALRALSFSMNTPQIRTSEELRADIQQKAQDDAEFRGRLLADPGGTIEADYGLALPEGFSLEVHEESAMSYHLVLPPGEELSQAELETIAAAGGNQGPGNSCG